MAFVDVTPAAIPAGVTTFSFVVPGDREWLTRSVVAVASTAIGGQPARGYTLSITDGTSLVAQIAAADGGTQPATVTITWCDAPAGSVAAGSLATSVAPLPRLKLKAGYVITGTIDNPVAGDHWISATAWYDYVLAPV